METKITDIIGKGRYFIPPFHTDRMGFGIYDSNEAVVFTTGTYGTRSESDFVLLIEHICELLNREHNGK